MLAGTIASMPSIVRGAIDDVVEWGRGPDGGRHGVEPVGLAANRAGRGREHRRDRDEHPHGHVHVCQSMVDFDLRFDALGRRYSHAVSRQIHNLARRRRPARGQHVGAFEANSLVQGKLLGVRFDVEKAVRQNLVFGSDDRVGIQSDRGSTCRLT